MSAGVCICALQSYVTICKQHINILNITKQHGIKS